MSDCIHVPCSDSGGYLRCGFESAQHVPKRMLVYAHACLHTYAEDRGATVPRLSSLPGGFMISCL